MLRNVQRVDTFLTNFAAPLEKACLDLHWRQPLDDRHAKLFWNLLFHADPDIANCFEAKIMGMFWEA